MNTSINLEYKNKTYIYSFQHKCLLQLPDIKDSCSFFREKSYKTTYNSKLVDLISVPKNNSEIEFINISPNAVKTGLDSTSQIIFEVTELCNLSCRYCALGDVYSNTLNKRHSNMDWLIAKSVLDYYIQIWKNNRSELLKRVCYIGFHGGEPLLNMNLVKKIVSYLENSNVKIRLIYSMTTNGILLDKYIDYLVDKSFILSVSMDGNRKENSYRIYKNGKEVFDKLYKNLKDIQAHYPDFFKENIDFITVAHNRNTSEKINSFFEIEFDKTPQIHELSSSMVSNYALWNSMRRSTEHNQKSSDNNPQNSNKTSITRFIKSFSGNYYANYRSLLNNPNKLITPTATCLPFFDRIFISAYGNIFACEKIGFKRILGKVTNDGIQIDFSKVSAFFNTIYNKFKNQCKVCYLKESCDVCFFTNDEYFSKEIIRCQNFYSANKLEQCIVETLKIVNKNVSEYFDLINNL